MANSPARGRAGLCAVLLLALAAARCAGGDQPAGEPAGGAAEPADEAAMATEAAAERSLAAGEPVTVRLELSPELTRIIRGLGGESKESLRLTLQGIEKPMVGANVRVFVNSPAAGLETPVDDPHCAGEVGFFPLGDAGGEKQSFLFDAGSVLARIDRAARVVDERYLDVTLVLVPPAAAPESAEPIEIPFAGVRLEAVAGSAAPDEQP